MSSFCQGLSSMYTANKSLRIRRRVVVIFIVTAATFHVPSPDSTCLAQNPPFKNAFAEMKAGNRLKAVQLVRQAIKEHPEFDSFLPQFLPAISDYSIKHPYSKTKPNTVSNPDSFRQTKKQLDEMERINAIQAIIELAKTERVVILNEAHDSPQHRAFGQLLALELRKSGFTHLGVETLSGKPGEVHFDYPTLQTGSYSSEPIFGDFLRQSSRAGFKMIAYEIQLDRHNFDMSDRTDSIIQRENAQSDNLIQHVLEADPKSRLFVYVGYSHATEDWKTSDDGRRIGWMAAQIKQKTGIDPLTIDQVGGTYNPNSPTIDPIFKLIHDHQPIVESCLIKTSEDHWLTSDGYFGRVDLTVFHPPQEMIDGRPNWLPMNGYRVGYPLDHADTFVDNPTLIQAFLVSELPDGLPVDQVLMTDPSGSSTMLLPPGKYQLRLQSANENKTIDSVIEVPKPNQSTPQDESKKTGWTKPSTPRLHPTDQMLNGTTDDIRLFGTASRTA